MSEFPFDCPFCDHTPVGGYRHEVTPKHPPQWAQDALDGAALRRLREALPDRTVYDVFYIPEWRAREDDTPPFTVKVWGVGLDPGVSIYGEGATIAEAADKCREALGDR